MRDSLIFRRTAWYRRRRTGAVAAAAAIAVSVAVGCGTKTSPTVARSTTTSPPAVTPTSTTIVGSTPSSVSTTSTTSTSTRSTTSTTATPPATSTTGFTSSMAPVTASQLGATWHPGCPVGPDQLRLLQLRYWGFDGQPHDGTMVVNASVTGSVIGIFAALYDARFPIRQMTPQSFFGGDDNRAAAADDTSGFNCRYAVAPGPPTWSAHAYGEAIDVNDVENPYLEAGMVIPPAGAPYLDRSNVRPGMAEPRGTLVDAFAAAGWQWGGRWTASPDYQHFSSTGR